MGLAFPPGHFARCNMPWDFMVCPLEMKNLFQWHLAKYEILWSVLNFEYVYSFLGSFR
jgi:hypothetical protein